MPKSAETYCRAVKKVIPCSLGVLGLVEHRLQSLGTFHNGVKKLAYFEYRFPTHFGLLGHLYSPFFTDRPKLDKNLYSE